MVLNHFRQKHYAAKHFRLKRLVNVGAEWGDQLFVTTNSLLIQVQNSSNPIVVINTTSQMITRVLREDTPTLTQHLDAIHREVNNDLIVSNPAMIIYVTAVGSFLFTQE